MQNLFTGITEHAEIRQQTTRRRRVSILSGKLVNNSSTVSAGSCARAYKNGVWGFASGNETGEDAAKKLLDAARENAILLDSRCPKNKGALPVLNGSFTDPRSFTDVGQSLLIDFAKQLDAYIEKKYPDLASRSIGLTANCIEKELHTSAGSFAYQLFPRTYIIVSMSATTEDGDTIDLFDILGGGEGIFTDYYTDPALLYEDIDKLYEKLMEKREGVFPEAGEQTCIIDSSIAGMIAHEAIGHTVEADFVLSGSVAGPNFGKQVASPIVNITDFANECFGTRAPLPVFTDDEGTPCKDAVIIKDGILTGYMHNLESSLHFGMEPTGNARAFAFSDEPLIRMRNTCILPGKDKLEDMIASIDKGYYLVNTQNGQADTTGEFMFGITMGYEIVNGKLGRALRDTTISGTAFNMLNTVDMLSDTVTWDIAGYCGKKQPMAVSMGGPAVKCKVNIGGR